MRKRGRFALLGLLASFAMLIGAQTPARGGGLADGLAVAATADGSRLVAGGSNRVLYELDPTTLEVKRRVWLGRQIMDMVFSPDGKVLVVESTGAVQWLKADTLEPFHTIKDARWIRPVPALDAVAMVVPDYTKPAIKILAFADAEERAAVIYDPRQRAAAYGVRGDGKQLVVLHKRQRNEDEEKITGSKIPKELREARGSPLAEFEQRHDGWGALLRVVDIASGEPKLEKQLWYSCEGGELVSWHGNDAYVIGYRNHCARIDAEGEVTVFALSNGFNNAVYVTRDGEAIWTGGMREGARTQVSDLSSSTFEIDKLGGFNEGYKAFTATADGTAFAGTSAFRVVRLSGDGKIQKVAPVY